MKAIWRTTGSSLRAVARRSSLPLAVSRPLRPSRSSRCRRRRAAALPSSAAKASAPSATGVLPNSRSAGASMHSSSPSASATLPPASSCSARLPARSATRWRTPLKANGCPGSNPSTRRPSTSASPWTGWNSGTAVVASASLCARTSVRRSGKRLAVRFSWVSGVSRVTLPDSAKALRLRWITRAMRYSSV
ncbi:hypothetical protein D9M69_248520 [compost metagenome]